MNNINPKFYSITLLSLMGISALLFILFMLGTIGESLLIGWCYLLFGIAVIVAIIFPIVGMIKNFKSAKYSLIGVGALVVIYLIGLAISTDESYSIGDRVVEGSASKYSEAGLITFYTMIILAVVAIVYTEISKALK
jgi:hypothetical protein